MPWSATLVASLASATDATSYATASWTPTANRLILAWVGYSVTTAPAVAPTLSGNNITWVEVVSFINTTAQGITLFVGLSGSSSSAGTTTADFGAVTQLHGDIHVVEVDGADISGTALGTVIQTKVGTAGAQASPFSLTLDSAPLDSSRCFAGYMLFANEAMTHRANWAELGDTGHNTPTRRLETQWRSDIPEQTASVSYTTTTSMRAIVVEIKASVRAEVATSAAAAIESEKTIAPTGTTAESSSSSHPIVASIDTVLLNAATSVASALEATVAISMSSGIATVLCDTLQPNPRIAVSTEVAAIVAVALNATVPKTAPAEAVAVLANAQSPAIAVASVAEHVEGAGAAISSSTSVSPHAASVLILVGSLDAVVPAVTRADAGLAPSNGVPYLPSIANSASASSVAIFANAYDAVIDTAPSVDAEAATALVDAIANSPIVTFSVNPGTSLVLAIALAPSASEVVGADLASSLANAFSSTPSLATNPNTAAIGAAVGGPRSQLAITVGPAIVSALGMPATALTGLAIAVIFKVLVNGRRMEVKTKGRPYAVIAAGRRASVT